MKKLLAVLLAGLLSLTALVMPASAASITISVGDQPYYVHGPGYWYSGVYYVWIPGHYCGWRHGHRVWCHGHYAVR